MPQNYTPEFKKKIIRLHEKEGHIYKSITAEYEVKGMSCDQNQYGNDWIFGSNMQLS